MLLLSFEKKDICIVSNSVKQNEFVELPLYGVFLERYVVLKK